VLKPDLKILPPGQRAFWMDAAAALPPGFVLYGGTAVALRCGHRQSVDFDWFSSRRGLLPRIVVFLARFPRHRILQQDVRMLTASVTLAKEPVKLSFFEDLKLGRVGKPDRCDNGVFIASPLDLLATKLKTIQQRAEAKDYLDIDALLRSGLDLRLGISAAQALYPEINPLWTAKTVGWFAEGDLESELPKAAKARLTAAAMEWKTSSRKARVLSKSLLLRQSSKT
jgi:Nucleotidyl transferase AbiEii toxin, Type IV TA system